VGASEVSLVREEASFLGGMVVGWWWMVNLELGVWILRVEECGEEGRRERLGGMGYGCLAGTRRSESENEGRE
jgi:hypothetical protein